MAPSKLGQWAAIAQAMHQGLAGRDFTPPKFPALPAVPSDYGLFVDVSLEPPHAIPWLITLKNWRWADYNPAGPFDPAQPLDNQVITFPLPKVKLEWGVGTQENALVDWPWGGLSFVLHARTVRMQLDNVLVTPWPANGQAPKLGAFVTPAPGHGGGGPTERNGPRYTTAIQVVGATDVLVPLPARAVGYRTFSDRTIQDTSSGYNTAVTQVGFSQVVPFSVDYDGTFGLAQVNAPSSASRWWPMHAGCTYLSLHNTNVASTPSQRVGVEFMLDLG